MKKQILNIVVTLSIVTTLTLSALANLGSNIRVTIPFAFYVNGVTMPAGSYDINSLSTRGVMSIRNRERTKAASFRIQQEMSNPKIEKSNLLFHRYGQQYFLVEIQDGANGATHELAKSKAERAAAKGTTDHLAQNLQPEIVTVSVQ